MSRQQVRTSYINPNTDRNTGRTRTYVEGNTVRKAAAMPRRVPREREERREKPRIDHQTRRNQQRALQMSPGYLLFLSLAICVTVGVCALYIHVQSEYNQRMRHVAILESQILDLKTDNDAALKRIESSINMDEIQDIAMNEMGMVYPGQDQIVCFSVETKDYMNQYQDIPGK